MLSHSTRTDRLTLSETAAKEPHRSSSSPQPYAPPHAIGNCGEGTVRSAPKNNAAIPASRYRKLRRRNRGIPLLAGGKFRPPHAIGNCGEGTCVSFPLCSSVSVRLTLSETAAKEPFFFARARTLFLPPHAIGNCGEGTPAARARRAPRSPASRYRKLRRRNPYNLVDNNEPVDRLTLSETAAKEPQEYNVKQGILLPPHAIGNCGEGT